MRSPPSHGVFKHAGYKVYIWDMQREYQKTELYTISVNSFIYNDVIAKLSYDEMSSIPSSMTLTMT